MSRTLLLRIAVVAALAGAAGCAKTTGPGGTTPRATADDASAVQSTVLGVLEVYNQPRAASLSLDERAAQLAKFYVPDSAFASDDAPMFFDPPANPSKPVVIGTREHLANMSVAYDSYARNGLSYNLQLTQTQVRVDGSLAVVIARTLGLVRTANGDVVATAPGRWTVVLERVDGRWLISHEHISFFNA